MKKQTQNATVNYDPEIIAKTLTANFSKTVNADRTIILGRVVKDTAEVATVSYNSGGDFLIVQVKPYSALTAEETAELYKAVPGFIDEMLED